MELGRLTRILLRAATGLTLAFIYLPIGLIVVYSVNKDTTPRWPPTGFTLEWWAAAFENTGLQSAFMTSITVALGATAIALVLGTLASLAVARYGFFGREAVSFFVVFPIALPGIVTGMALSRSLALAGFELGWFSIVVGHATFCIVLVYNNTLARLRRTARSYEEASADLGSDTWMTFRTITFPQLRSALFAGALLAFALSFDEIIVTIFTAGGVQTLPIWIFQSFRLANQVPLVNVAGLIAILLSVIPVYIASRITQGEATGRM
jgi:putative spermidine/putrescine transport system permease protein